jgi:diguanylate cyclase (GGDEF)-like protein/putative nucleotidyltransferase with HDIG domain
MTLPPDTNSRSLWPRVLLALLLLALPAALAVLAVVGARGAADRAERETGLAEAYDRARFAAGALKTAGHDFDGRHPIADGRRFAKAAKRLDSSLVMLERAAAPEEQVEIRRTRRELSSYRRSSQRAFAAFARPKVERGRSLRARKADPIAEALIANLHAAANEHRAEALDALGAQSRAQNLLLVGGFGGIGFGGIAVLVIVYPRVRHRAQVERAQREALDRLERAALTDNLTGLRNQRAFDEDMASELERRNRQGGSLALVMVDMVGLKQINDNIGHQAGDERIKTLAECLRKTKRASDLAYRIGGDEFAIVLPGERAWGAFEFAQRLRRAAEEESFGISVGVTDTFAAEPKHDVIRRADRSLIEAKRSHRSVVIYSESPDFRMDAPFEDIAGEHAALMATVLARAVDAKDSSTRSHCETVSELAVQVGQQLGLSPTRLAKLRLAGLLHDVGKIGIADEILRKPGPLDDDEVAQMRMHSVIGRNIVAAARLPEEATWILHHHERPDGKGYPHALSGDQIPLESRILLAADAFEAITADRHYRAGQPAEVAIQELERQSGAQFDPACVEALKRAIGYVEPTSIARAA